MQKRNTTKVFLLHIITLGMYLFYWCSKSKKEVNTILGREAVPTVWWLIVPFGFYWWAWQYAEALDEATGQQIKRDFTFGIAILATLGLYGSSNFFNVPFRSHSATNTSLSHIHINWTIIGIVVAVLYLLFTALLGIFPTVIQSKINKLGLPINKTPASPGPAALPPANQAQPPAAQPPQQNIEPSS